MAVTPSSVMVLRRRGRPRAEVVRSSVSAWVPASVHDRLIQAAEQRGMSVSSVACEALTALVDKQVK